MSLVPFYEELEDSLDPLKGDFVHKLAPYFAREASQIEGPVPPSVPGLEGALDEGQKQGMYFDRRFFYWLHLTFKFSQELPWQ